ncbi:MAG: tetratricopeptide repeat protein [Deltaproteobacteria bacterium]|nr:tetratricopeptide repeat protein [Deltaproteobacteria bacterium]
MEKDEQRKYIIEYLRQYRKELSTHQIEKIIKEEQASNPLYLRTLLEELRVFGIFEELENKIEHYLQARTIARLFALVLERLEKDYERERKGLVKEVTTLIWASRRGLSETELFEVLGSKETPMPRALFSPLYLALEESLVSRAGLLTFFHDFLKKAVESRYLYDPERIQKTHLTIADYFDQRVIDERKVDELPWQLCRAENWPRLRNCVTDMDMFLKLRTETKQYELTGYWLAMGARYDIVDGYNEMIARYEGTSPDLSELFYRLNETAFFLNINARFDGAEPLSRRALAISEKILGPDHSHTAISLNNLATLLYDKGNYDGAEPLYRRSLAICEKVIGPDHPDTAYGLHALAVLLKVKGDYDEAEPLYHRALAIREKVLGPDHRLTRNTKRNLDYLLKAKKKS